MSSASAPSPTIERAKPNTRRWNRRMNAAAASESPVANPASSASFDASHITPDGTAETPPGIAAARVRIGKGLGVGAETMDHNGAELAPGLFARHGGVDRLQRGDAEPERLQQ